MTSSASSHHSREYSPASGSGPDSVTRKPSGGPIPSADSQQTVISQRPPIAATVQNTGDAPSRRVPANILGQRLGDIELVEHIGGGGMGQVYRGEDKRLGREVAVKILARDQSVEPDAVRRFLNEARSAARLNHQNIAQVYSAGESEDHPYIVFEFVQGVNLRAMIEEQGPLTLEEALSYTLQIADALAHAAERRVVHRDVKPSNVLIAPNGQAKLIDLGLARLNSPGEPDGDLTASGVTLGTFDYISPEQARDPRNADSRSDIYSLGCTLFYMLTGRPPFPEGTVLQKLLQHQGDDPPDVCQFRPDLPDEVSQVLAKMMAKDPRRRYPDSARLMEALLTLADLIGLRPAGPAHAIWLPPQESRISTLHRQTPWLAPTVSLACLVLALHLFWSSRETSGSMQDFLDLNGQPVAIQANPDDTPANPPTSPASATDGSLGSVPPGSPNGASNQASEGAAPASSPPFLQASASPVPSLRQSLLKPPNPRSALPSPSLAVSYVPGAQAQGLSVRSMLGPVSGSLSAPTALPPGTQNVSAPVGPAAPLIPLIVTADPQNDNEFRTLEAALASIQEAKLIELRYNGRTIERPFIVSGRQLTIRAGSGFSPVLAFEPRGADPVLCPRDMIQVSDAILVIEKIALELNVPRDMPSESWTLFRLLTGGRIRLDACSLRIRNASDTFRSYHQDVAFFRIAPEEPRPIPSPEPLRAEREPDIELRNSMACGEAGLIRVSESRPLRIKWQNGLLATTEPALSVGGSGRKPNSGARMYIEWRQVTAVTGNSLVRLTLAPHRPHLAPLDFSGLSACVLSSRQYPLIQITGATEISELRNQLVWTSESNVFQESRTVLVVGDAFGAVIQDDELAVAMGLPTSPTTLKWQATSTDRPMQAMECSDFKLNLAESGIPETTPPPGFLADPTPGPPAPVQPAAERPETL